MIPLKGMDIWTRQMSFYQEGL